MDPSRKAFVDYLAKQAILKYGSLRVAGVSMGLGENTLYYMQNTGNTRLSTLMIIMNDLDVQMVVRKRVAKADNIS